MGLEVSRTLHGSTVLIDKQQVAATQSNAGVPVLQAAAGGSGVVLATTTGFANVIGITQDPSGPRSPPYGSSPQIGASVSTYQTAQQSDNSDPERVVSIIYNPDQIVKARMSGGAAEGTALTVRTVTTASTTGLAVTTAESWTGTEFADGVVWGYQGLNAGVVRKITSTSSTAGTVTVAFPLDTAVGETFIRAPWWPFATNKVQLTTNLMEADASIAVGTGGAARCVALDCRPIADNGIYTSWVFFAFDDHVLNVTT